MTSLAEEARADEARAEDVAAPADEPEVRTRGRRPSPVLVLASLLAVAVIALVVMSWLSLGVLTQVRDQAAAANGLQRCFVQAQLSTANATDAAAYRTAVQACLNK